tara:strand:- start:2699 stop:3124 length:426 start_codon:yes stop_codon:yes gene_type:complete
MKLTGWSKFKLHQQIKRKKFPKSNPRKEERSGLARFWFKHVVDQWLIDNTHLIEIKEEIKEKKKNGGLDLNLPTKHELMINSACKLLDCTPEVFILDAALTKAKRIIEHYDLTAGMKLELCDVSLFSDGKLPRTPKARNTR